MATFTLAAKPRELTGRKTRHLREEGIVPAVVYGAGTDPQSVSVDRNEFVRLYKQAGESSVIGLTVDGGKELNVLIHDFQRDPLTGFVTHIDFLTVDMSKPIEADVALEFVGESMAVKSSGGTLVKSMDHLAVKALPSALVSSIEVDLTALATLDDVIRVSDLTLPQGIEAMDDAEQVIATVSAPRSQEEVEALDKAVEGDVSAVEVEGKKKEAEEEGKDA
jgi:large subunit ribosomal protein L25